MLNLFLNYVVCGRHLEFMVMNMLKVKTNVRNGIPMPELVKIVFGDFPLKIEKGIGAHF